MLTKIYTFFIHDVASSIISIKSTILNYFRHLESTTFAEYLHILLWVTEQIHVKLTHLIFTLITRVRLLFFFYHMGKLRLKNIKEFAHILKVSR